MVNTRVKISSIVENQLPSFVRDEFPLVSEFLKQYYISLENQGGVLDILQNIDIYSKIDNITNIVDNTKLSSDVGFFDKSIQVETTYGFPDRYGLIKIDNEIITYTSKTSTTFEGCIRGFSGISSLDKTNDGTDLIFDETEVDQHTSGSIVSNLSVLFLKEFFKKTKKLIAPGFENTSLFNGLNEKVFIKQSKDFYSSKGTDESFKILFGALYGEPVKVIKPRDELIRSSDSQYRIVKDLVVEQIEGNPLTLLNRTIYQSEQQGISAAYGTVTNVQFFNVGNKDYYVLSIDYDYNKDINVTGSTYGTFTVHPKTRLISEASIGQDFLDVDSTLGYPNSGTLVVNLINGTNLTINYSSKSSTQFFGCTGITQQIPKSQEIILDVYASNYENPEEVTSDDLVKFRITGVVSDFNLSPNTRYYSVGDDIYIKTLGQNVNDPRSKSFLYNSSIVYDIRSFRKEGNDSNLKYSFQTFDDNIINIGDSVILSYTGKVPSGFRQTEDQRVNEAVTITGINIPKREFAVITTYPVVEAFTAERTLIKSKFVNYPDQSDKFNANVSNSYVDSNRDLYTSSSSLASYENPIQTKIKSINFSGILEETNILFSKNHGFYTGESVKYFYFDSNNKIINLEERKYYVERVDEDRIKIYNSQSDIYTTKYSQSGKDLSIKLNSLGSSGQITNTLVLFDLADKEISPSKIIRKFANPVSSRKKEETNPGFVGLFVNGVEILNYKSKDSIYYGEIQSIEVLNSGKDYDVINPPKLKITDSLGYGATGNVCVTGSLKRIEIIDQGHDYLEVPSITILGGNGNGAIAQANLISYDHIVNINASQYKGAIDLTNDVISFSTYHRFRDYEQVIYETNGQPGIIGLTTNSKYFIGIQNERSIKLYNTFSDATLGINTVGISSFGSGIHSFKSVVKKNKLGSISIINEGSNYSSKKNIAYSDNINIAKDLISIKKHGYKDGEVIVYSYSQSPIAGLSSISYYAKVLNDNEFRLCEIGTGSTASDFYYKTNQYVNLTSTPFGEHIFNYPEIQVTITGKTGVSTITPGNQGAIIKPIFRGSIESVSLASTTESGQNIGGIGYGSREIINYNNQPNFELLQGSNAQLFAVVSEGKISEIIIENGGSGYDSTPDIEIIGSGKGASLTPIISNGSIVDILVINGGSGYEKETFIKVVNTGSDAKLYAKIREWKINEVSKETISPEEGGLLVDSLNGKNLQFSSPYLAKNLRKLVFSQVFFAGDIKYISDFTNDDSLLIRKNHSTIVGWAYDGNPIYGPYGYTDPFSPISSVVPMRSGYIIDQSLQEDKNRPPYPLGFFANDYAYKAVGDLDEHNGRYCVTPEYPNGVYAYFCPIDPETKIPQFPYVIGNTFKDSPIQFNFDPLSNEDDLDPIERGWKRNTYHYNLLQDNSRYEFLIQPNKIRSQISKVKDIFSGSVNFVDVVFGGDGYRIGDSVIFDNEGTNGSGAYAEVKSIKGKEVNSISYSSSSISNIQFFVDKNFNGTVGISTYPHSLSEGDVITISGLSTSNSSLNNSYTLRLISNDLKLITGIGSTSATGIVTYFNVIGNLNFPYLMENDIIGIGSEKIKVLSVDNKNSRIKVLRSFENTVGTSHSIFDNIFEYSRKFVINETIGIENNYTVDREIYFNPSEVLGLGVSFGVGIGTTIFFSNPGSGITSKYIPTRTLYFENHNLNTGDKLIYSSNGGAPISVSTNGVSSFTLGEQSIVYVAKISNDLIGISTFKVGLSTTGSFVGVDSSRKNQGILYFTNFGSGSNHSFKTHYDNVLSGSVTKTTATILTDTEHELIAGDSIEVDVLPGISTYVKVAYNDSNRRIVFNPKDFSSSDIDITNNTITINNHGYYNGKKIIHSSSSPAGGLLNDKIYYVVVVDVNTIKFAETYYNATKQIPNTIEITTSVGANGKIYEVNPNIFGYRNQSIIFDVSDSSLSFVQNSQRYSAFVLSFFIDPDFVNQLDTKNITRVGESGLPNSTVTLKIDDGIPNRIYYNLLPFNRNRSIEVPAIKKDLLIDSENIPNNNSIEILVSKYSGRRSVIGVTTNTIVYSLTSNPEHTQYTKIDSEIAYFVNSGFSTGPINSVNVTKTGSKYESLPGISSIVSTFGNGAILEPISNDIGKVKNIEIVDYGFDYSADRTVSPLPKLPITLKIEPLNSIERIDIVSPGKNYTSSPNLILIDGVTNQIVDDLILDYSLETKSVTVLQNTKGIYNSPPRIIPVENSNGSRIKNIGFNTTTKDVTVTLDVGFLSGFSTSTDFPFSVGDQVLVENTQVSTSSTGFVPRGYNSKDYDYNFFTITSIDPNIGGVNPSIVFNLSNYFSGTETPGVFDPLKSSGRIVAEKDFPVFSVKLKKNQFFEGETITGVNVKSAVVQKFDDRNDYLKVSSVYDFEIGDLITGNSSKSKGIVGQIIEYDSEFIIDSTSIVKSGSNTQIGFLNDNQQRIHDNDYYQYFSYSLKSKVPFDRWDSIVDSLNHTSGFKKFSDLTVESFPNVVSGNCNSVSGICTDQNFGSVIASIDIFSDANINCYYDFDIVTENSINLGSKIVSDEITFSSRIIQDYIKSSGNVVLKIDDLSPDFDDTPREDVFSIVDSFNASISKYRKYYFIIEDTFFTNVKQFNIVSLLQDGSFGFMNQYGRLETETDLGSFDFRIFGSQGQIQFFPIETAINDYNLYYATFSINEAVGVGTTYLGNVVKLDTHKSELNVGYASTTIVGIASTYRSSKLLIEISSVDSEYREIDEITIVHDNSNVHFVEYGQLDNDLLNPLSISGIGTYNFYLDNDVVKVDLIPNSGITTDYNINVVSVSIANTSNTGIGTYRLSSGRLSSSYSTIASSPTPSANTVAIINSPAKGAYIFATVEDTTNGKYAASELVVIGGDTDAFISDFGNVYSDTSIGEFSASLSGANLNLEFTPNSNINVEVRCFIISINPTNPSGSLGDINLNNFTVEDGFGSYIGRENDIKRSFYLTHNNLPIFHRYFDGSNSEIVDTANNKINLPDHFFRTGERVVYQYDDYRFSTENAIGIAQTDVGGGIGVTDKLPRDLYVVKVDNYSIKFATTAQKALKLVPEVLDLTSVGIGTNHKIIAYNENNRVLISLDNIIQSPLVSSATTTSNIQDISFTDTLIKLSSLKDIFPENLLNINDEIFRVIGVGVGSTNVLRVQRKVLGSELKFHSSDSLVSKVDGSYNIVDNTINFIKAPYGPRPIGTFTNRPDERDFTGITTYSRFNGRVFMRSSALNSSNDPYSENYIFDDISSGFSGIKSDFALKVNGVNITDISSSNAILLINDIFQGPENSDLSSVVGNYYLKESSGITSVFFKGSGIATSYDINTSGLPIGGIIISSGSTAGFGYQPLVSAGGTAVVSMAGTIQSISIGNSGSGYRPGVQKIVNVAVTTSSLETPNLEFIGTAVVSNGHVVSVAITNPGSGYTSTNPPIVIFDSPLSYTGIPLVYSSSSQTGIGTEAKVDIVVGQGSSVISFEFTNDGYNYQLGDILTIPFGGLTGIPTDPSRPFDEFRITVDKVYNDKFSAWTVGDLQILDDFSNEFDGLKKSFQLKLNGVPVSIFADKNVTIDLSSTLLVFVNDILQIPGESYVFDGGSVITFTEAPKGDDGEFWDGDSVKIYFYRGTSGIDTLDVDILETIKIGDDLRIYDNKLDFTQTNRGVEIINSSNTTITNTYSGTGISTNEFLSRPVNWTIQTEDRVINGKVVGKDRQIYEPTIEPTTNIIQNVGIGSTVIFVENLRTFFDNEKENASNQYISKIKIISQEPKVGAYATAIVSAGGSISHIDVINPGIGYTFAPVVVISNPVGLGTTAVVTSTISNGSIVGITTVEYGTEYSQDNPPYVLIESPKIKTEIIENVDYEGDFGIITGINTSGVASTSIIFDFYVELDSYLRDSNIVGSAITISEIKTGYYFVVKNSNIGFGVTSLDESGSVVGVGTTFLDNIYKVSSVSIGTTNVPGIGVTYVAKVAVRVQSYNKLSGIGFSNFYGEYSWGRISFPDGSRGNPKSFDINNNNGVTGLQTSALIKRYNPLKYFGYST